MACQWTRLPRAWRTACVVLVVAGSVAGDAAMAADRHVATLRSWVEDGKEIEALLQRKDAESTRRALKRADALHREILALLESGKDGYKLLGWLMFLRAVAEHRQGDDVAAAWHWHGARAFSPDITEAGPAQFPEAATFKVDFASPQEIFPLKEGESAAVEPTGAPPPGLTPPKIVSKTDPKYPRGVLGYDAKVVVRYVVNAMGIPEAPELKQSSNMAGFDATVLEMVREMRYEPARVDGKPVAVYATLRMSFKTEVK